MEALPLLLAWERLVDQPRAKLLPSLQSWESAAGSVGRTSAAVAVAEVVGIAGNILAGRTPAAAGHTAGIPLRHILVGRIVDTGHNPLAAHTVDIHYIAARSRTVETGLRARIVGRPVEMIVRQA